jgi:YegS/Rv2252/BmrU family lipid kinase
VTQDPPRTVALPRTATLIVNARSRIGRQVFREATEKLRAAGVAIDKAHAVRNPKKLGDTVRKAVEGGAAMVIVGGGDGSLSSSVDFLVGTATVFGVLPLGTANSFARTLGIPLDLDGAIDVIANGRSRRIDLGMIDGDYFANCAAIGISPLIAETVPHGLKKALGRVGYLGWAAFQLTRFRPFKLTIGEGDDAVTIDALEVRIANGPYHGGTQLVEEAAVDNGEIVVQAVTGNARHRLIYSWGASVLRLQSRKRTTCEYRGQSLRIATDPPLPISIDGEVLATTPVTASVARGAILVAAPLVGPVQPSLESAASSRSISAAKVTSLSLFSSTTSGRARSTKLGLSSFFVVAASSLAVVAIVRAKRARSAAKSTTPSNGRT